MAQVLENAVSVIDGFDTKMRVEYDDQDLAGLMETAEREIQSSSQIPKVVVNETVVHDDGNEEQRTSFSKFISNYNKGRQFFIILNN